MLSDRENFNMPAEDNRRIVHRFYDEVVNGGKLELIDELVAPDFVEPLAELVALDFAETGPARALLRVRNQIVLEPKSADLQELLGRVHLARHEEALAEGAFLKALVLDSRRTSPYLELGRLYAASGKYDQALAKLSEAVKVDPKNLAALMLSGAVYAGKPSSQVA